MGLISRVSSRTYRKMTKENDKTASAKPKDKDSSLKRGKMLDDSETSRSARKRSKQSQSQNESADRTLLALKTIKMHGCQFCGKEFNNKSNYNRHVRQMHLNFEIKCESCGTTSSSLNQHQIHKVYCGKLKCACGKTYDTRLGFKGH